MRSHTTWRMCRLCKEISRAERRDERWGEEKKWTGRAGKEERVFFVLGEAFQPTQLHWPVSGQKRNNHHSFTGSLWLSLSVFLTITVWAAFLQKQNPVLIIFLYKPYIIHSWDNFSLSVGSSLVYTVEGAVWKVLCLSSKKKKVKAPIMKSNS